MIPFYYLLPWVLASYLNVVVWRRSWRKSLLGHSQCDHCHRNLSPLALIPIFGFLLFGGRCSYCHKRISGEHPVFEALFISGWYLLGWAFGLAHPQLWLILLLYCYGYLLSVYDLRYREVPRNEILLGTGLIAIWRWWHSGWQEFWPVGIILLLVVSSVLVTTWLTKKPLGQLIGLADWWVVLQVAVLMGLPEAWWVITLACVLALALSPLAYFGKKIPFVTMLYFATLVIALLQQLSLLPSS